jgi:ribosomal protein S24E
MNVIKDFRNELLKRNEVKLVFEYDSNPGYEKSKGIVSEHFKAAPEVIVVKNVKSKFGRDTFLLDAFIYDSKEDLESTEPKVKEKKK